MRGRRLLRDPPTASICAFCSHRAGALRPRLPSHIRRRYLQTTRPAAKPPATAAAARTEEDRSDPAYSGSSVGWSNQSSAAGASNGNWNRPAFGRSAVSSTTPSSGGFARPAFGSGKIELTIEEQRVADAIKHKEQNKSPRPTEGPNGRRPESQGDRRPLVRFHGARDGIQPVFHSNTTRQQPLDDERRKKNTIGSGFTFRRTSSPNSLPNPTRSNPTLTEKESESAGTSWGNLRRRVNDTKPNASNRPTDVFAASIDGNEKLSRNRSYTPLSGRPLQRDSSKDNIQPLQRTAASAGATDSIYDTFESPATNTVIPASKTKSDNLFSRGWAEGEVQDNASSLRRPTARGNSPTSEQGTEILHYQPLTVTPNVSHDNRVIGRRHDPDSNGFMGRYQPRSSASSEPRDGTYQPRNFGLSGTNDRSTRFFDNEIRSDPVGKNNELERERETQARKRAEKYAAEDEIHSRKQAVAPKGREREKNRRREQFVAEYEEDGDSAAAKAEAKRQRKREKAARKAAAPTSIFLPEYISVANLAMVLKVRVEDFIEKMEELGFEETGYDFILNGENAGLIAQEYNFEAIIDRSESEDLKARPLPEDTSNLPPRAPVVTIMGHVDHGKTTLLDYLRKSSVAAGEHGGITQHIGAFSVPLASGKVITFLDTPGHAAFLSMRQRGANVTDIVILVVAADDSVKPQTIEAINHAKAAKVPIIVAVNKVDKEDANVERVKQDLARHGVDVEDFGGDTQVVCVSGKTGQGMADLEEAVVTLSEILDMRAETDGPAEGWVLEASIKSMGKVATVLVRRGTMCPGDFIVAGNTWARIRCLRNEAGIDIEKAGPGTPVEIDGWKEQPLAGDEVLQAPSEQKAKSVVDYRLERDEREKLAEDMEAINESRKIEQEKREREKQEKLLLEASKLQDTNESAPKHKDEGPTGPKQIFFIVKGDVSGSVEAVVDSITAVSTKEVQAHILRSGVGQLSEFDVEHASAAKGFLINFNTPIDPNISQMAEAAKVEIIDHNIIYRLVDEVKDKLSEHLPPLVTQRVLGEAEIAQVFEINIKGRKHKAVAGCKVRNGTISKNAKVRVMRNGEKIYDGTLSSLKNVKKDVSEIRKGSECGMGFDNWTDFQAGDQIQSYETIEEKRYL